MERLSLDNFLFSHAYLRERYSKGVSNAKAGEMPISTGDLCILAAELAAEHGAEACDYAWRAYVSFDAEGELERAHFWFLLSVLLEDILTQRIDPERPLTLH